MVLMSRVVHLFRASSRQLTPVYCARHSQFQSSLTASVNKFIHNVNNKYMIISYINLEIEYYRNYYHESMIFQEDVKKIKKTKVSIFNKAYIFMHTCLCSFELVKTRGRHGVSSIPELELMVNSEIGIGIDYLKK